MPRLMIIIGSVVIMLFVAILYTLTQNNAHNRPSKKSTKTTPKPEITLPEKPTERWAYLKELENPQNHEEKKIQSSNPKVISEREKILNNFRIDGIQTTTTSKSASVDIASSSTTTITTAPSTMVTQQSAKNWAIQCGAFKDKSNAQTLKAQIAMAGVESKVQQLGQFFRVIAGSNYTNRTQAETIVKQLTENGIKNCIVSGK